MYTAQQNCLPAPMGHLQVKLTPPNYNAACASVRIVRCQVAGCTLFIPARKGLPCREREHLHNQYVLSVLWLEKLLHLRKLCCCVV